MILSAVVKHGRIYALCPTYEDAKSFADAYTDDANIRNICGDCLMDMSSDIVSHYCDTHVPERFLQLRYASEADKD